MFARSLIAALFLVFTATPGFTYTQEVEWLRNQSFNACKKFYVWRLIDNYFQNPRWESGWSDEGDYIVNVYGKMKFQGRNVNAQLQFTIDPKRGKFDMNGLAFNGEAQSKDMRLALIKAMCDDLQ
uniref:Uncharacterized protein n=1 Tax=Fundidesulfovibrio putealis TaxID=270496 RepID=A0A7C4AC02_9BACT